MVNRRAVSAPYWSIRACGSTPLFFDFDIFSVPPTLTDSPSDLRIATPSFISTSAGLNQVFLPLASSR